MKIAKPPRELLPFLTKILRISSEETRQRKIRAHENSEVVPNIINEASKNSILLNFIRQSVGSILMVNDPAENRREKEIKGKAGKHVVIA